jgi:hypothetical protein
MMLVSLNSNTTRVTSELRSGHHNTELVGQNLPIVMSNILSYHMSLPSEFRVEMSNILSYHMSLPSEFRVVRR